jgi:hypothetical protein
MTFGNVLVHRYVLDCQPLRTHSLQVQRDSCLVYAKGPGNFPL